MIRNRLLFTASILLTLTASGRGQAPQGPPPPPQIRTGTGVIAGVVVDSTGQPVTDALVTLGGRGGPADRVVVDPRGRFVFRQLPPGGFGVVATRPGYVGGGNDQQEPTSATRPIEVGDGQQVTNITLRLWKLGVIGGAVRSDDGEPVAGVEMQALRRSLIGGRWILAPTSSTTADDLGHYRFDGLLPGEYIVAARPETDQETALLLSILTTNPTVAVDVMAALSAAGRAVPESDERARHFSVTSTSSVTLAAGAEQLNADVRLKRTPAFRVAGTLSAPVEGVPIRLVPVDPSGVAGPVDAATTTSYEAGEFEFTGVPAGKYALVARSAPQPAAGQSGQPPPRPLPAGELPVAPAWSGSAMVNVGTADLSDVTVALHKGAAISGSVVFGGNAPAPPSAQLSQITLRLDSVDQPAPVGQQPAWRGVVSGNQFRTVDVPPGEYLLRVANVPRGWTLYSATSGGRDILDVPIAIGETPIDNVELRFSDIPLPSAPGTVHDDSGAAVSDATVVVFPVDRSMWRDTTPQSRRLRLTRPTVAGRFGVNNLPPGNYFVAAIAGELPSEWQDPKRLEALAQSASKITLTPGPVQPIELKVMPGLKTRPPVVPRTTFVPAQPSGPKAPVPNLKTRPPAKGASTGGVVTGTVIDQKTGRPVNQATVLIAGTDVGLVRATATDVKGTFTFSGVPAGHFLLGAAKAPYLTAVHGASRPGRPGALLAMHDGQRLTGVSLRLVRGAVISGRVTDDHDRPVTGARVRVIQHRDVAGDVTMNGDAGDPVTMTTDDRGAYRVFNLPAGEYVVAVQARGLTGGDVHRLTESDVDNADTAVTTPAAQQNGMSIGWSSAYAPSTVVPSEAAAVTLASGQIRTDVNVRTKLARFVRVEGLVSGATGTAPSNVQITLGPRGTNATGALLTNLQTRPGQDNRFTFPNVPPGDYTIVARTLPPPPPADLRGGPPPSTASALRWAMRDIAVREENVSDLTLEMQPGLHLTGDVHIEGLARLPADLPLIRVGVRPTAGSNIQTPIENVLLDKNGAFTIEGLLPGRYRVFLQVPNNDVLQVPVWFAKTAGVDGVSGDVFDVPMDVTPDSTSPVHITITGSTQEIDGTLRDASGTPLRDQTVVVFSTDRRFWFPQSRRIVTRQSSRDGRFVFGIAAGLPAGEYYVAEVPDGRANEQLDVLLLEELAKHAERVQLNADETKTLEVRAKKF